MYASQFIDYFISQTSAAVTRETVRQMVNIAQNAILGTDTEFMRITPDPYFVTQDVTYVYVMNDTLKVSTGPTPGGSVGDVRAVREVYSRQRGYGSWWSTYVSYRTPLRWVDDDLGGRLQAPVTIPDSVGALSNDCTATWDLGYNPGENPVQWRARAYRWPAQVLSEETPLTLPDDFVFDLLFQYVTMLVEQGAYGAAPYPRGALDIALRRFQTKYSAPTFYNRPRLSPAINC